MKCEIFACLQPEQFKLPEAENRCVFNAIGQAQDQPAALAAPGEVGFPDVGVDAGFGVIAQAVAAGLHGVLHLIRGGVGTAPTVKPGIRW